MILLVATSDVEVQSWSDVEDWPWAWARLSDGGDEFRDCESKTRSVR
jgi:hypothetical protein